MYIYICLYNYIYTVYNNIYIYNHIYICIYIYILCMMPTATMPNDCQLIKVKAHSCL